MEAPFRYPIAGLEDVERLFDILAESPDLVSGSLRFSEGQELLVEQLKAEGRLRALQPAIKTGNFRKLVRALWHQPLLAQHPRFLRFNAQLMADPTVEFSMRINVPTTGNWPRWVNLEGSRDPAALARLRAIYVSIGQDARLPLLEV